MQAIRQLQHPNLIHFEQVWCCQGYVVVGMELADGSLADLLDISLLEFDAALSPEATCFFLSQAALALDFLNTRQHVVDGQRVAFRHCDVKPSNILLKGKTVKVADFSLAVRTSSKLWYRTQAGTPCYAAPETFHGCLSENSDQYGLAVTYCQVRGGRLPYPTVPKAKAPAFVWPEPDLTMLGPLERSTIARGLAPVPQDRWRSCSEMMDRLAKTLPTAASGLAVTINR